MINPVRIPFFEKSVWFCSRKRNRGGKTSTQNRERKERNWDPLHERARFSPLASIIVGFEKVIVLAFFSEFSGNGDIVQLHLYTGIVSLEFGPSCEKKILPDCAPSDVAISIRAYAEASTANMTREGFQIS